MNVAQLTAACGRVCVVSPTPPPYGGMSLQAEKLVSRLRSEGIEVEVLATNPPLPRILKWAARIPVFRTLVREVKYLFSLLKVLSRCEIVHHLSASGFYFFAHSAPVLLLGRLYRKRIILNYRGGNAAKFLNAWGWCVIPLMRSAESTCVPSHFLREIFSKWDLESAILPNIADTEAFVWKERLKFVPTLLITRDLDPMYNVECTLRAFRIIKQRFAEAVLTVAGDGSEAGRLHALVGEWKLSGVHFLGAVAPRDLPALYASHDLYINSSNVDNFPGTLVEAACCGLPRITTGAGGIPHMIRNYDNGIVVALNDDRALASGVIEILEQPEIGRRLARNARSWAEQFTWKNVLPQLLTFYIRSVPAASPAIPDAQAFTS
jgi:glycosyltransferase involved in cell wall biosynthesis